MTYNSQTMTAEAIELLNVREIGYRSTVISFDAVAKYNPIEDGVFVSRRILKDGRDFVLGVVFDGTTTAKGADAKTVALNYLRNRQYSPKASGLGLTHEVVNAVMGGIDEKISKWNKDNKVSAHGVGVVAALVEDRGDYYMSVARIGDSRAILVSADGGARSITMDQGGLGEVLDSYLLKYRDEPVEEVRQKFLTLQDALMSFQPRMMAAEGNEIRSAEELIKTYYAIGGQPWENLEIVAKKYITQIKISLNHTKGESAAVAYQAFGMGRGEKWSITSVKIKPGDKVVLCSDGVLGWLKARGRSVENLGDFVNTEKGATEVIEKIIEGRDNHIDDTTLLVFSIGVHALAQADEHTIVNVGA